MKLTRLEHMLLAAVVLLEQAERWMELRSEYDPSDVRDARISLEQIIKNLEKAA